MASTDERRARAVTSFAEEVRTAVTALDSVDARYVLIGGLAVSVRTEPRFTRDLDFAVAVSDDAGAEALTHALRERGSSRRSRRCQWPTSGRRIAPIWLYLSAAFRAQTGRSRLRHADSSKLAGLPADETWLRCFAAFASTHVRLPHG